MFIFVKENILVEFKKDDKIFFVAKVESGHPYIKDVILTTHYFVEEHKNGTILTAVAGTYEECYDLLKKKV